MLASRRSEGQAAYLRLLLMHSVLSWTATHLRLRYRLNGRPAHKILDLLGKMTARFLNKALVGASATQIPRQGALTQHSGFPFQPPRAMMLWAVRFSGNTS